MPSISSQIEKLTKERDEYRDMYLRMATECSSYEKRLQEEIKINDRFRTWFARNAHWTQRFNNMMKYDPELGNYNRPGADDEIIIPEPEHWEVVKHIPVKKISTVVEPEDEV